jgi:hypothetical protein
MFRGCISIASLSLAAALAGCSPGVPFDDPTAQYTQRILTVSPTAGNAQAANLAVQTSTPWPRDSQNTRIPGNGARLVKAVQRYEGWVGGGPSSGAGASETGSVSPAAASPPAPPPPGN